MFRSLTLIIVSISFVVGCGGRAASTVTGDSGVKNDASPGLDGSWLPDAPPLLGDAWDPTIDAAPLKMDIAIPTQDGGGGIPCTSPASCAGYGCNTSLGICRTACYSDGHCAFDHICDAANKCVPASGCSDDATCLPFACDQSVGKCRASCDRDSHCSAGNVCDNGSCVAGTPCTDDTPCNGYLCDTQDGFCRLSCSGFGFGGGPSCAAGHVCGATGCTPEKQCTNDASCQGYKCENGACRTLCFLPQHCATDYQCGSGFQCSQNVGCTDNSPCNGYSCENGVCRTYCFLSQHCSAGFICNISFGSQMATCVPQ
jgi:hypothetical protein